MGRPPAASGQSLLNAPPLPILQARPSTHGHTRRADRLDRLFRAMSYRSSTTNVLLTPIDRQCRVATLAEDRVKACFATLIELIFFNEREDASRRFFSISVSARGASESISIIADASDLAAFEPDDIAVDETLWEVCAHEGTCRTMHVPEPPTCADMYVPTCART